MLENLGGWDGAVLTWENASFEDPEQQTADNQTSMIIYKTLTHRYKTWDILETGYLQYLS